MTILLINDNPVVSRLLSLCTRDDEMVLETVSNINEASAARYDVLFVDEASCEGDVASLSTQLDVGKKIYLSYSDKPMAGFDETVKKPFLPSQIIAILNTVEVRELVDEVLIEETLMDTLEDEVEVEEISFNEEVPSIFPLSAEEIEEEEEQSEEEDFNSEVLNLDEIEKIKALLDMDEEEIEDFDLDEEAYESRKIEVIKEQLISDGLEIIEEEEIVDELNKEKKSKKKSKKINTKTEKIKKSEQKKKKNEKFTEDEWSAIEGAIGDAINKLKPKKIKKLLKGKEIEVHIKLEDKK